MTKLSFKPLCAVLCSLLVLGLLSGETAEGQELKVSIGWHNKDKANFSFLGAFDLGFTDFLSSDYGDYQPDQQGFMDLKSARSIHVGITLFEAKVPFNCRRTFGLSSGVELVWDNYVFDNDITLSRENGRVVPVPIDAGFKKSKFSTFGLRVPLVLGVNMRGFSVSGGVYGGLVLSQHTKYKKPKHKDKGLNYANMLQGGVTARIGFKCVNVFAHYALTDLFKHDKGPGGQPITVGIGIW